MISRECREALDLIHAWRAEMETSEEPFDPVKARDSFKMFPRPEEVVKARTFPQNGIAYEWVTAVGANPDRRLLYLHGGGFISGDLDTTVPFATLVSEVTRCSVLAVDYRLAPEHPYPAALEDACRAFRWMSRNGPHRATRPRAVFLAGDSAGGGLALSAALKLRDAGEGLPDALFVFSPFTDLSLTGASLATHAAEDPVLTERFLRTCSSAYAGAVDRRTPYLSPLFADLRGLPPVLVQAGGREILLDDSRRFVEKARAAGVDATLDLWPEMFHGWQLFAPGMPEAWRALQRAGTYVARWLAI